MSRDGARILLLLAGLTLFSPSVLLAAWLENGTPLCSALQDQQNFRMVSDGSGGVILVWEDYRSGSGDIYAQRVDNLGEVLWATSGAPICTHVGNQLDPDVASDGSGGAFVVWSDYRIGLDVYAQHVDAQGDIEWALDGIIVSDASRNQTHARIVPDGVGGSVITWTDTRFFIADIYAQRVDATGSPYWVEDGIPVCDQPDDQANPAILLLEGSIPDNTRIVVAWEDTRNFGSTGIDLFFQKLNLSGTRLWTTTGLSVSTEAGGQYGVQLAGSPGGSILTAWEDSRNGTATLDLSVDSEKFDPYGAASGWDKLRGGYDPHVISDGTGGAILAWTDLREVVLDFIVVPRSESWARKWDSAGNDVWGTGGQLLYGANSWTNDRGGTGVASDGAGGGVFSYLRPSVTSHDIFAQRLAGDSDELLWGDEGLPVCISGGDHFEPRILALDDSGVIVAWRDGRDEGATGFDLYAQRLDIAGATWGYPAAVIRAVEDIPSDEGGWVRLRVRSSDHDRVGLTNFHPITGYNVWREMGTITEKAAATTSVGGSPKDFRELVAARASTEGLRASPELAESLALPPGDWESLGFHAAFQQTEYSFLAPTRTDSTATSLPWETYVVTVHTTDPLVVFTGEPNSGYSVDNLPPEPPSGLLAEASYQPTGLELRWDPNGESDLAHYVVHRGPDEGFVPDATNLVAATAETLWFDEEWTPAAVYHYKAAAVDRHGNVSDFSLLGASQVTAAPESPISLRNRLAQNHPNPFNPATTIVFELTRPARVDLTVYDLSGRVVRRLLRGETVAAGRQEARWDGRDEAGRAVAAVVYFYQLDAGTFRDSRRMVLAK